MWWNKNLCFSDTNLVLLTNLMTVLIIGELFFQRAHWIYTKKSCSTFFNKQFAFARRTRPDLSLDLTDVHRRAQIAMYALLPIKCTKSIFWYFVLLKLVWISKLFVKTPKTLELGKVVLSWISIFNNSLFCLNSHIFKKLD